VQQNEKFSFPRVVAEQTANDSANNWAVSATRGISKWQQTCLHVL